MQTKEQALAKVKEMVDRDYKDGTILKKCAQLLDSGGLNIEKYEDNYILPRILLHVALKNEVFQYKPRSKEEQKEAANLEHF